MRIRSFSVIFLAIALAACGQSESEPGGDTGSQHNAADITAANAPTPGARPKSFNQCAACHAVEPDKHSIGPSLAGVFDAKAGHVGDYAYSTAMRESGLTWDAATLDRYLANPRKIVPGNKMGFSGMRDAKKRAELIEYLKTL